MPNSQPSSFTGGQLIDYTRRQGAASVQLSPQDQLLLLKTVYAKFYAFYPWWFTLTVTPNGSIPCVNLQQDYAGPSDLYRLTRGWFYVPTQNLSANPNGYGTIPPFDDPAVEALYAAQQSAAYVSQQLNGGGTPAATIYPSDNGLTIQKRLIVNLYPYAYTQIKDICQLPNTQTVRLSGATAVASTQPYELQLEYQPILQPLTDVNQLCWFPDDYQDAAQAGILYYLYLFNNDPRAGAVEITSAGNKVYSGQLGVWYSLMEESVAEERAESVSQFTPDSSLGSDTYTNYGGWFA